MREILFRGKCIAYGGAWVEGAYYHKTEFYGESVDESYIISSNDELEDNMMIYDEVFPETVGQFTGLTDKNGKKIFEGDIFKPFADEIIYVSWIEHFNHLGLMVYSTYEEKKGRKKAVKTYNGWCMLMDYSLNELEIIGNIHDNPELLQSVEEARK